MEEQRDAVMESLRVNGFAVIPDVLTEKQCTDYSYKYKRWYQMLLDNTPRMKQRHSVIQGYRVGQFSTTWEIRLQVKTVFEMLWGTKKLLTSVDGIALSKPPESGDSEFRKPDDNWLHLDQRAQRQDLHAYQGAVYVEETTDQDYCFRVMKGSHEFHSEFFAASAPAREHSKRADHYRLKDEDRVWYEEKGCPITFVPVPRGGMVVWDSRTVHDNAPPCSGRKDTQRWRCVTFVSMTPAQWASGEDLAFKNKIYNDLAMTSHWSSQSQRRFSSEDKCDEFLSIKKLPQVAKSKEVKQLMGVIPYNFNDGQPNGPPPPLWR